MERETIYFHFNSSNGLPAVLPFTPTIVKAQATFRGIPGVQVVDGISHVPAWQCANCREHFIVHDPNDLKHGCTNNGGIRSGRA